MTAWARRHKNILAVTGAALVVAIVLLVGLRHKAAAPAAIKMEVASIKGKTFVLSVASTPESRALGLSHHPPLGTHEGMLFTFPAPDTACFWMKDMLFNLDILWFNADKKLIYQQKDVSPDTYPASFCPPADASYVVEVNAGTSVQLGLAEGDMLNLQKQ